MEQKKKFSAFDVVNVLVLAIGLVMALYTIVTKFSNYSVTPPANIFVSVIGNVAIIIAYIAAVVYMLSRYSKNAAYLYKIFMYAFVVKSIKWALTSMTSGFVNYWGAFIILAVVIFSVLLATAKDFGKTKTFIIAGLLLAAEIIEVTITLIMASKLGFTTIMMMSNLILTIEACIMVLAKYRDKDARGAK